VLVHTVVALQRRRFLVNHLLLELTMVDPTKRREEIQDEITRLGKLQKEAIENAPEGSPTGNRDRIEFQRSKTCGVTSSREITKDSVVNGSLGLAFDQVAMRCNVVQPASFVEQRLVTERAIAIVSRLNLDSEMQLCSRL
jgi:hypothetical protein